MQQDVTALDIRNIIIRPELEDLFKKETGYSYPLNLSEEDSERLNHEIIKKSIKFCNKVRSKNITLLYDPELFTEEVK